MDDNDFDITDYVSAFIIEGEDDKVEIKTSGLYDRFNHLDLITNCEKGRAKEFTDLLLDIANQIVREQEFFEPGSVGTFGQNPELLVTFSLVDDRLRNDRILLNVQEPFLEFRRGEIQSDG